MCAPAGLVPTFRGLRGAANRVRVVVKPSAAGRRTALRRRCRPLLLGVPRTPGTPPSMSDVAAELKRLLANSHAPHSGVHVAAAVEGPDGRRWFGVNVENAAYPEGVCAEASAISAAITSGETRLSRVFVASSLP